MKIYNLLLIISVFFIAISCGKDGDMVSTDSKNIESGKSGSTARITIVGNYMYAVDSETLKVIDINDPSNPNLVNELNIGFGIETIYPFKDKLFMGSNFGMYVYDITNPQNPTQLSYFSHATACDPVIANDTIAFVTLQNSEECGRYVETKQIDVINIENLDYPYLIKSYFTNDYPYGLDMNDSIVVVCHGEAGFTIYDMQKLADPYSTYAPEINTISGITAYDAIFFNNILFIIGESGFYQYNYSDVNNLQLISSIITN